MAWTHSKKNLSVVSIFYISMVGQFIIIIAWRQSNVYLRTIWHPIQSFTVPISWQYSYKTSEHNSVCVLKSIQRLGKEFNVLSNPWTYVVELYCETLDDNGKTGLRYHQLCSLSFTQWTQGGSLPRRPQRHSLRPEQFDASPLVALACCAVLVVTAAAAATGERQRPS